MNLSHTYHNTFLIFTVNIFSIVIKIQENEPERSFFFFLFFFFEEIFVNGQNSTSIVADWGRRIKQISGKRGLRRFLGSKDKEMFFGQPKDRKILKMDFQRQVQRN